MAKLIDVTPSVWSHRAVSRCTAILWSARTGTVTVEGIVHVYRRADGTITLARGRYGKPVRLTESVKCVAVYRSTDGKLMTESHAVHRAIRSL